MLLLVQEVIERDHVNEIRSEKAIERGSVAGMKPFFLDGSDGFTIFGGIADGLRPSGTNRNEEDRHESPSHDSHRLPPRPRGTFDYSTFANSAMRKFP